VDFGGAVVGVESAVFLSIGGDGFAVSILVCDGREGCAFPAIGELASGSVAGEAFGVVVVGCLAPGSGARKVENASKGELAGAVSPLVWLGGVDGFAGATLASKGDSQDGVGVVVGLLSNRTPK